MGIFRELVNAYPFYKKARELWMDAQEGQILKGLQKYPEPFTPSHWTAEQLLNHALEESVDLTHYLVGLKELLDEKDAIIEKQKYAIIENCELRKTIVRLEDEIEQLKLMKGIITQEIERNTLPVIDFKPPYADLDD